MRRDFVANVSHELRTPLTSIKGFVETILDGAVRKKERERFLNIIDNHVNRLNTLIEDLLTISHLEKDGTREEVTLEQAPLNDVIENAVNVCADAASHKDITVTINTDETIQAQLNPSLFEQALVNLIDNAIKYSDENTEITITSKSDNRNIVISVTDQGAGIAKKHFHRLFERFYRVDKARSRKMGGTGLGLSIVKHIVNIHNGTVHVESEVGKGSTFTIILPLFESETIV
jgi:two-component system phosphate regulon sensor histidine kinase PhoR